MTASAHGDLAAHLRAFQAGDSVSVAVTWLGVSVFAERTEIDGVRRYFSRHGKHLADVTEVYIVQHPTR